MAAVWATFGSGGRGVEILEIKVVVSVAEAVAFLGWTGGGGGLEVTVVVDNGGSVIGIFFLGGGG